MDCNHIRITDLQINKEYDVALSKAPTQIDLSWVNIFKNNWDAFKKILGGPISYKTQLVETTGLGGDMRAHLTLQIPLKLGVIFEKVNYSEKIKPLFQILDYGTSFSLKSTPPLPLHPINLLVDLRIIKSGQGLRLAVDNVRAVAPAGATRVEKVLSTGFNLAISTASRLIQGHGLYYENFYEELLKKVE